MTTEELLLEQINVKMGTMANAINTLAKNIVLINTGKQFQKIPEAARTLGFTESNLRKLCDEGVIPCSLERVGKYKLYKVDIIATRKFIEEGGIIPKLLKGK